MYLLPAPQNLQLREGCFTLSPACCVVLPPDPSRMARTAALQLMQEAHTFAGMPLQLLCGQARPGDIRLALDASLPSQSYTLAIAPDAIDLIGDSDAGLLHGAQTLRQIIRQSGPLLPCCAITDAPALRDRGFYHDVTRGRVPTLDTLKKLADDACIFKLNQLQLYVEHTYLFRDLSEMWRVSRPLTAQEIMELDAYCADRGVELVPSLACFGHLFELLHTRSYHDLAELTNALDIPSTMPDRMSHHTVNITDPRAFELVAQMIDEFMPLFSSRRFNICADETFDLGKGRGKAKMDAVGERAFYMGFVKRLCEHVIARGRQPMFWGDIVLRFPDALKELPEGVICLNWDYAPDATEDAARTFAQVGAAQYVCPGTSSWNEWMPALRDSYRNIARMAAHGKKYGALGLLNTDWGDYGHINDPAFSLPGLIYGAALSWQEAESPYEQLNEAISRLVYLDASGQAVDLLSRIPENTVYSWYYVVRYKEWAQGRLQTWNNECPFAACDPAKVPVANQALRNTAVDLRRCAARMDTSTRPMLHDWLVALDGVCLWNEVGACVADSRKSPDLAQRLEQWFRLYEQLWRRTGHEAELWRIRDVTYWYADLLR